MKSASAEQLIQSIRQFHDREQFRLESDSALLAQFIESRNEFAFEELLFRLGPMVWGICVRGLGHSPEADDAFQAVFLILIRKASQLRRPELVAGWLCRTTQQVVRKAVRLRGKQRSREMLAEHLLEGAGEPPPPRDWLPIFDREVNQLPEKYRSVLILCELRQYSRSEAAQILGLNLNTLSSRLARAKEILRDRLAHTGVALPAGLAMTVVVPTTLCSATLNLALALLTCPVSPTKVIPATLLPLMQGGWSTMFVSKFVLGFAVLVLVGFGVVESRPVIPDASKSMQEKSPPDLDAKKVNPSEPPKGDLALPSVQKVTDLQRLQGAWVVKKVVAPSDQGLPDADHLLFSKTRTPTEIYVRGDEIAFIQGTGGLVGKMYLREPFTSRWIDLVFRDIDSPSQNSQLKQVAYYGVYEFGNDETLQLSLSAGDRASRPATINGVARDQVMTLTFQRKPRRDLTQGETPPDILQLVGEWTCREAVLDESGTFSGTLIFETDRVLEFGVVLARVFSYSIDSRKDPHWIDLKRDYFEWRGSYTLSGDNLYVVLSRDNERATDFTPENRSKGMWFKSTRNKTTSSAVPLESLLKPDAEYAEQYSREIFLPVKLSDPKKRLQIREIRLLVSRDQGSTWQWDESQAIRAPIPEECQFLYAAPSVGRYDFGLQTIADTGESFPKIQDLRSEVKIHVLDPKRSPAKFPSLTATLPSESPQEVTPSEFQKLKKENEDLRQKLLDLQRRMEAWEQKKK